MCVGSVRTLILRAVFLPPHPHTNILFRKKNAHKGSAYSASAYLKHRDTRYSHTGQHNKGARNTNNTHGRWLLGSSLIRSKPGVQMDAICQQNWRLIWHVGTCMHVGHRNASNSATCTTRSENTTAQPSHDARA